LDEVNLLREEFVLVEKPTFDEVVEEESHSQEYEWISANAQDEPC
jgi:hypothetical protein